MSSRFHLSEGGQKVATDKVWKDRSVVTDLLSSDSSDRKITRNQKRRHDEINHIQKTYLLHNQIDSLINEIFLDMRKWTPQLLLWKKNMNK